MSFHLKRGLYGRLYGRFGPYLVYNGWWSTSQHRFRMSTSDQSASLGGCRWCPCESHAHSSPPCDLPKLCGDYVQVMRSSWCLSGWAHLKDFFLRHIRSGLSWASPIQNWPVTDYWYLQDFNMFQLSRESLVRRSELGVFRFTDIPDTVSTRCGWWILDAFHRFPAAPNNLRPSIWGQFLVSRHV